MRNSDRWITPAVIVTGLLVLGVLGALVIAAVAYLAARGVDPDPMVKTVGALVAAAGSLVTVALQLATRQTTAKTERNTGTMAGAVYELADTIHAMPRVLERPPVPPPAVPARHAFPETAATPGPRGE